MSRFIGFIGPTYLAQSPSIDAQRCLNLYLERNELGTSKEKEIAALYGTPGLRLLGTAGSGPFRGAYTANNGTLFMVSGNGFYEISRTWGATLRGTLKTTTGPVSLADNGIHVCMVDGSYGYVWTLASSTFQQITDPDFLPCDMVAFQDGYFIFNDHGTQKFFISALNDVTFDALDIASAEGLADNIVGHVSDQRNLYLFGTNSLEVFYDSGATFPFERIQGAFVPVGCMAAFSILRLQGQIYWLGQDEQGFGVVYRAQGYAPSKISTFPLDTIIKGLLANGTDLSTARAWSYQQGGHGYYCLNLPGAQTTWSFDTTNLMWHERSYLSNGVISRHRAEVHAAAYNTNVVGDYQNGNFYALDPNFYFDGTAVILRRRAAPHISKDGVRVTHESFQADIQHGVGLDGTGNGTDPQAILRWSDDQGQTWSNERYAPMGKIGKRRERTIFRRLGQARDRVYELSIVEPVKTVIAGAWVELEEDES